MTKITRDAIPAQKTFPTLVNFVHFSVNIFFFSSAVFFHPAINFLQEATKFSLSILPNLSQQSNELSIKQQTKHRFAPKCNPHFPLLILYQSASSFSMPLLPETSRCLHKPPRHRQCAAYLHKISVSPKPAERQSAVSTSSFQTAFPFRPSEKTKAGHRYPAFIVLPALFFRRPISSRPCCSAESRY